MVSLKPEPVLRRLSAEVSSPLATVELLLAMFQRIGAEVTSGVIPDLATVFHVGTKLIQRQDLDEAPSNFLSV
jgi:hypothetical protein